MKKVLGIVLTFLAGTSYAQQGFNIGADAGLNTVWITHQDDYGQVGVEHVLDYGVAPAISLGYNFTDKIGLQLDFIYSFQGAKYQQTLKGGSALNRLVELDYFKIPVYFKYENTLPNVKNVKAFIMAGPEMGFLQSASIISNYVEAPYAGNDERYRFEPVDFELAGEAGVYIYASKDLYFTIGARLDYGLLDMNAPGYKTSTPAAPYSPGYNVTAGLIAGISYSFGKK
jgi:hypothetical protein